MKRPLVGVAPLFDPARESYWMLPGYFEGLRQAGALPVMLPAVQDEEEVRQLLDCCDGLLLTGGQDVAPELYGRRPIEQCGTPCPERDRLEKLLFEEGLRQELPILGICRGHQLINVLLGGTLYQDLPFEVEQFRREKVFHEREAFVSHMKSGGCGPEFEPGEGPDGSSPAFCHQVQVLKGTPLAQWVGVGRLIVNSYHHQGIEQLASALRPMAVAPDGLIEAVWMPQRRFVASVQWHPELAFDKEEPARAIFRAFVQACEERKKGQ